MTQKPTKFKAIRGTRDILPPESALWNRVEQTARDVFATYGYGEIRSPIFEDTELFARSVGEETDIVSKEMFPVGDPYFVETQEALLSGLRGGFPDEESKWLFGIKFDLFVWYLKQGLIDGEVPPTKQNETRIKALHDQVQRSRGRINELIRDDQSWMAYCQEIGRNIQELEFEPLSSLRPEATASVVRAYIEHGMNTLPGNVKLYYIGPMFRRERPQKGRYRQFYQIGAEVLGQSDEASVDAEVIEMLTVFLERCGLTKYSLYINSIGCQDCRPRYVSLLRSELEKVRDKLGPDSQRRISSNPLRILDSKLPDEQDVIASLPPITQHLDQPCRDHFTELQRQLTMRRITFSIAPRLVRGLDYYVRTTFEITASGLGSQNAVCGGGRYDGLVASLGGPKDIKGIGFAIGTDRMILSLQHLGTSISQQADVLIAWKDQDSYSHALTLARILRDAGLSVQMPTKPMGPRDGLSLANRLGIPVGVVVGPDEVSASVYSVKLLSEGEQVSVHKTVASDLARLLLFRVLLERAFIQLAKKHGIEYTRIPPKQLLSKLIPLGAVPAQLFPAIELAFSAFNRIVHGEQLSPDEQTEAVGRALFVIHQLSKQHGVGLLLSGA